MASALVQWCSHELSNLLGADASEECAQYLLGIESHRDLEEYLQGLLDIEDPRSAAFIKEILRRKSLKLPDNVTIYKKCAPLSPAKLNSKVKPTKTKEKKAGAFKKVDLSKIHNEIRMPGDPIPIPVARQQISDSEATKQGARRKQKFIGLYSKEGEARSIVHLTGRHWCECQAQKHSLVANCMKCGRVVCQQEGSGPCLFCGTLVCTQEEQEVLARRSKTSEKLRRKLMGESGQGNMTNGQEMLPHASIKARAGLDKAMQHLDKLIEYDHSTARRTHVIDDESDYFSTDTNQWLTDEERKKLGQRRDELRELKYGSRLNKKFTLDFAGRRVTEESNKVNMYDGQDEVVQAVNFGSGTQASRQPRSRVDNDSDIINPNIVQEPPQFIQGRGDRLCPPMFPKPTRSSQDSKCALRIQDRELMEMSDEGLCLSMHQPWASLLVMGIKPHEGRSWYSTHRGRLWIAAASHQATTDEIAEVERAHRLFHNDDSTVFPTVYPISCLLGCVNMTDCLSQEHYQEQYPKGDSTSPYVFICENPQELVVRFPIKGRHKIWKLDGQVFKSAKKGLRTISDH